MLTGSEGLGESDVVGEFEVCAGGEVLLRSFEDAAGEGLAAGIMLTGSESLGESDVVGEFEVCAGGEVLRASDCEDAAVRG